MTRELIKTDKNGTKYFRTVCACSRCGGTGVYVWGAIINGNPSHAGTCYKCNGSRVEVIVEKEYTEAHAAKLAAQRAKYAEKREAEWAAKRKEEEAREANREAERKAREAEIEARKAKSQHCGTVGQKLTAEVELAFRAEYEVPSFRGYGTSLMNIYGMRDKDGNLFVWKTAGSLCMQTDAGYDVARRGDALVITGTVKEHAEYKGEKQTVLTRVKVTEITHKEEEQ